MNKLYKVDSKGKIRQWWIESEPSNGRYRTHSGIVDGKVITTEWTYVTEKNVGRANFVSKSDQVISEVQSAYTKQQNQGKYTTEITAVRDSSVRDSYLQPMLAHSFDPNKNADYPYAMQPKLDGVRCVAQIGSVNSRNGKPFATIPHIQAQVDLILANFPDIKAIDGELYNHSLRHDFEKIVSLVRKQKPTADDLSQSEQIVQYHVYDVVPHDMSMPFSRRIQLVEEIIKFDTTGYLVAVPTAFVDDYERLSSLYGEYIEQGYEGAMIRTIDSPYQQKRSNNLLKHKSFLDQEFKLLSIEEGVGNWMGLAKSATIELDDGTTQKASIRGNREAAAKLLEQADQLTGTDVTVAFQGRTADNKLRFPVITMFWRGRRDI